ncbi:hypothetical protein HJFPF1_08467 [Paramyrothecium foliicola]|nr:hypothetical protein HJFPF1_08467 [Paramyrothecium foliicola]
MSVPQPKQNGMAMLPQSKKTLAEGGGVLIMGLPRSGTYSVAHAMRVLGHERVFHNLDMPVEGSNRLWGAWFRAGWACMPYLREEMGLPWFARKRSWWGHPLPTTFTRRDWDELVGNEYQVIADISVNFAADLIQAYPDAQVILWERDVDSWLQSFDNGALRGFGFHSPVAMFCRRFVAPLSGMYWPTTQWYAHAGWLRARDYKGMRANARAAYHDHIATVKKLTKPGNLLMYRLGAGWEPLCEFLGVPVPAEPFPHLNEREALKKTGSKMLTDVLSLALWNVAKYPLLLALLYLGLRWKKLL